MLKKFQLDSIMSANTVDIEDYLQPDPEIHNQKYFVMSYILPKEGKNELKAPLVKVRGAFKTMEEAEKRIEKLKRADTFFNMYVCNVGQWGSLVDEDDLLESEEVEKVVYREKELNDIFQKYKENKDKAEEEHVERLRIMKEKAVEEGKPEYQKYLTIIEDVSRDEECLVPQLTPADAIALFKLKLETPNDYIAFYQDARSSGSKFYAYFKEHTVEETASTIREELQKVSKRRT